MATERVWTSDDIFSLAMTRGAVPWAHRQTDLTVAHPRALCVRCGVARKVRADRGVHPLCQDCKSVTFDLRETEAWL